MINLRYHIVSITAVFLALAIGVVMGTSFLSRATVDQLNDRINRAEGGIRATRIENQQLRAALELRVEEDQALARQGSEQLFQARLAGVPVLIVAAAGADQTALNTLRDALTTSSADFKGSVTITDRLHLEGDDAQAMATLLDVPTTDRAELRRTLVSRMGDMLVAASTPTGTLPVPADGAPFDPPPTTGSGPTSDGGEPALLTELRSGGWLTYQPPNDGPADLPLLTTGGYRYVVVSGSDVAVPDRELVLPLLRAMAQFGPAPVVVASAATGPEAERTRAAVVGPIRGDEVLRETVSTVDDLELFSGVAAVVLALEDLPDGVRGHYGVGDGATSLLPPSS